jgi:hypothetical protein
MSSTAAVQKTMVFKSSCGLFFICTIQFASHTCNHNTGQKLSLFYLGARHIPHVVCNRKLRIFWMNSWRLSNATVHACCHAVRLSKLGLRWVLSTIVDKTDRTDTYQIKADRTQMSHQDRLSRRRLAPVVTVPDAVCCHGFKLRIR